MGRQLIPEETVQDVLLRADIVEVLGDYVQLKKAGASYKGLCPFHQEKTPSFTVNPNKGLFYCFGCQTGGNVVRFLMQQEHLAFPEAVRLLAERYGVKIPEADGPRQPDTLQPLYRLHQAAAAFFHRCLLQNPDAQAARAYCRQRQINRDVVEAFALGYAPSAWEALGREMRRQGFSEDLLVRSGLVVARETRPGVYDRFRHRLMFPIHDRLGRPVAFGGRTLEANAPHVPKYLNSPETPIFHKGQTLYGLHLAKAAIRQHDRAIIVEGYTDVIACYRHGVTHVAGTLGTALTERHVEMLRGLAREVVLIFDSDAAGGAATERGLGLLLEAGLRVRIVDLPAGDDPDSFLQQHGKDAFLRQVDRAQSFLDYVLARAKRFSDMQTPAARADCSARVLPLLRKIDNPVEQWAYLVQLAKHLEVPVDILQRELRPRGDRRRAPAPPSSPGVQRTTPLARLEYDLLRLLLDRMDALPKVRSQLEPEDFQAPELRRLYGLLGRIAAREGDLSLPGLLQQADTDEQRQLLAKMAAMPVLAEADEVAPTLDDYVRRLRQRRVQLQLQQLKAAIRQAEQHGNPAEQQRLLQAYTDLHKEMRLPHRRGGP